ncbi:hypothetical protein RRG08_053275 [Elysia crispata]|uniref:Uncharacterized protein n=1 Tax=Elysia crispata TaxID=231223 RepID=A0AAE1E1X6_9GAST|nr:hypothetical protein RRG08_053275 [Elysia crispata]
MKNEEKIKFQRNRRNLRDTDNSWVGRLQTKTLRSRRLVTSHPASSEYPVVPTVACLPLIITPSIPQQSLMFPCPSAEPINTCLASLLITAKLISHISLSDHVPSRLYPPGQPYKAMVLRFSSSTSNFPMSFGSGLGYTCMVNNGQL